MQRVKIRAVQERKKLKDAIAEFIERGMSAKRPRVRRPRAVKLRGRFLTTAEIEAAIAWGRD